MMHIFPSKVALLCLLSMALLPRWSAAAAPSAEQALKLVPVQQGVDYDRHHEWAHEDSNFGPRPYQGRALTN